MQVGASDEPNVQCRRILSALLPAAELLLRAVLDLRSKHWQERHQHMDHAAGRCCMMMEQSSVEARFTATCGVMWRSDTCHVSGHKA